MSEKENTQKRKKKKSFFSTVAGKRFFNFAYGTGAAIVILGAMFKLTHLPGANLILIIGMSVEAAILFLSSFEPVEKTYDWESVFPVLETGKAEDRPNLAAGGIAIQAGQSNTLAAGSSIPSGYAPAQVKGAYGIPSSVHIPEAENNALIDSIKKMNEAAESINQMAQTLGSFSLSIPQIDTMVQSLNKIAQTTDQLSTVSESLAVSYKDVSLSSESIGISSKSYTQQMEILTQSLYGLNRHYETQREAIEKINLGLHQMKDKYMESAFDTKRFREETDKLVQQLAELNMVYGRMLKAMTPPYFGNGSGREF